MKTRIRQVVVLSFALCSLSLGLAAAFADGWPQWMQNPQHTGFLNVVGQNLNKILANIVYDPLVPDEQAHLAARAVHELDFADGVSDLVRERPVAPVALGIA